MNLSRITNAIKAGLQPLKKPEPLRLSEWADEHFYLSAESSYIEGKWETLPYQRAIMDCISNDDIRDINWLKSARVGYTKIIVAATAYFAEHKKRNQVIFQPVDQDAKDFVKDEINPMLRDVSIMRPIFPAYNSKSQDNTLEKKVFIGSTLDIRGGKAAKNYRRLSKDVVYYDELDGFDRDVENEGDPVTLGDKRIEGATFPKSIRGSTPKTHGLSLIEHYADASDAFFRYYVPCPHCEEAQYLKWGGPDASYGIKWDDNNPATAHYVCEHCAAIIEFSDLTGMVARGTWRDPDKGIWIDEDSQFRDASGELVDPPMAVSFHIWTAYSIMTSWSRIVGDFLRAKDDPSKLKTFVNTTLGETWDESAKDKVDPDSLCARREVFPARIPDGVLYLTIGADTQDDRVEWEVFGWGAGEERWSIEYGRMYGDLTSDDFWDALYSQFTKEYRDADNVIRQVGLVCIDSGGHYTDEVYKFSYRFGPHFILPIKGANVPGKPVVTMPRKQHKGIYLCEVGSDTAKEIIYHRYKIRNGPGCMHWPDREEFDLEYFRQATAEVKVKKFRRGQPYYEWNVMSGRRNEATDCAVYGLAAIRLGQQYFGWALDHLPAPTETVKKPVNDAPGDSWVNIEGDWM